MHVYEISYMSLNEEIFIVKISLSGYWHTDSVNCLGCQVRQRLAQLALEWVTVLIVFQFLVIVLRMRL